VPESAHLPDELARRYIDIADVIIVSIDRDGQITLINKRGQQLLGYSERELLGKLWFEYLPPSQREAVRARFSEVVAGRAEARTYVENYVINREGDQFLIAWRNTLLRDDHGNITGTLSSGEDITDRRRIEAELQGSEERLRLALGFGQLGTWDYFPQTGQMVWDARCKAMWGLAPDAEVSISMRDSLIHADDRARVYEAGQEAMRPGGKAELKVEFRVVTPQGDERWIAAWGKVLFDNDGKPVRFIGTNLDLTERHQAEEKLRRSEERLRLLAEYSPDFIYRLRLLPSRRLDYVSPAAKKITGYSVEEHYADPDLLTRLVHPDDRAAFVAQSRAGPPGATVEVRWVRKDGTVIWVEHRVTSIYDPRGVRVALHGIARDVTDRRRSDLEKEAFASLGRALSSSLDLEEALTQVAEEAVGHFADWSLIDLLETNGSVRRFKAVHSDPSMRRVAEGLEHLRNLRAAQHLAAQVVATREATLMPEVPPGHLEAIAQSPEHLKLLKSLRPVSWVGVPLLARERLIGTMLFISSDPNHHYDERDLRFAREYASRISVALENAQLYREANQAIQAREDVLRVVAHDLRNPLNAALLAAGSILNRDPQAPPAIRKSAEVIHRSIYRANRLIQDLLDVVRAETLRLQIDRKPTHPLELLGDATDAFLPIAADALLRLQVDAAGELPPVLVDGARILQVFSNLIGNAIKFTPAGGTIHIGAQTTDAEVCFWVTDSGPGIPAGDIPHLFDRFWQAQHGDRRGTGLGLAIAKGIIEAHGGRIWVESRLGEGTTFRFTVPLAATQDEYVTH
jgi:PAS domain S-box-containing protein